ncbi:pseudouridine-5'-phosphate glycosidase [Allomeiothermus silvanus]|uniref:pseudouridine-5'-phosphate glycosidase n=1 Tax=Allomeiothermus silvanus TaxID=52022 RepID=UPI0023F13A27|nr:pseudouridine-5'-phosphate glycosidase [Allomeiothermus silvanus]
MRLSAEVETALREGQPVVALESTVITHGLPRPLNLQTAQKLEAAVREEGAIPATIAVLGGEVVAGLSAGELERLALDDKADKASLWNLAALAAQGKNAGTTVATTTFLAHRAGVAVFATGGIGGVHPDPYDESADLTELSRTPIVVVCSGAKSILNLAATLERLESYGVTLLGYRTDKFPAFHTPESPFSVPAKAESPQEVARIYARARELGLPSATLVTNPVSRGLPFEQVQGWVEQANQEAARHGIQGKSLTPYLLRRISELSSGQTDQVNLRLLEENARLAARIAGALVQRG